MNSENVTTVVVVDRSNQERAIRLAEEHDVQIQTPRSKGFEPVSTVALLLLGTASAVATVVYLIDKEKGGQVIDLREGATRTFFRSEDIAYGLVVLIAKDGSATVEVKESKGMFGVVVQALVEALIGSINEEIEKISSIAEHAVGEDATIHLDLPLDQLGSDDPNL